MTHSQETLLAVHSALLTFGWALALLPFALLAFGAWYRRLGNVTQRSSWTAKNYPVAASTVAAEAEFFGPMLRSNGRFVSRFMTDYQGEAQDRKAATEAPADLITVTLVPVVSGVKPTAYLEDLGRCAHVRKHRDLSDTAKELACDVVHVDGKAAYVGASAALIAHHAKWDTCYKGRFPLRAVPVGIGLLDLRPEAPEAR